MGDAGEAQQGEYVQYVTARLPMLRRLAYSLCGDLHRADDLVQDTITEVFVKWAKIREVDRIDPYVERMLVNRFIDERRRSWAKVRLFRDVPERPAGTGADFTDRSAVRAALRTLSRAQQAVLVLRYGYDLSVTETAELLNCSEGNVKSHASRGLTKLRGLLGEQQVAAGWEES